MKTLALLPTPEKTLMVHPISVFELAQNERGKLVVDRLELSLAEFLPGCRSRPDVCNDSANKDRDAHPYQQRDKFVSSK